jgi:hypothetical protein
MIVHVFTWNAAQGVHEMHPGSMQMTSCVRTSLFALQLAGVIYL